MEKNPIFSRQISAGTRVYYIDVHEDRKGQRYVAITEIPTEAHPNLKKRERIFIHADKFDDFTDALKEVATHMKGGEK